jgi:hypothetical protein
MLSRRAFLLLPLALWSSAPGAVSVWPEIVRTIKAYEANPSPATAAAASKAIPKTSVPITNSNEETKANEAIHSRGPMAVLEQRVLLKERESVVLAFRMRHIADGAFLEDLEITLGKLIRLDPALFVEELQRAQVPAKAMGGLVGNLGESFVDELERQCKEWKLRKEALLTVSAASLKKTRDQAVASLRDTDSYCKDAQPGAPADAPMSLRSAGVPSLASLTRRR